MLDRYDYDPYGQITFSTESVKNDFGFAGGYRPFQGLVHFGQRYYDPSTARWTQQDPLNQAGSLQEGNRYIYAGADPVDNVDPGGLIAFTLSGHVGPFGGSVSVGKGGVSASGSAGVPLSLGGGISESHDVGDSGVGIESVNPCIGICRNDEYRPTSYGLDGPKKGSRYLGVALGGFNYTATVSTK